MLVSQTLFISCIYLNLHMSMLQLPITWLSYTIIYYHILSSLLDKGWFSLPQLSTILYIYHDRCVASPAFSCPWTLHLHPHRPVGQRDHHLIHGDVQNNMPPKRYLMTNHTVAIHLIKNIYIYKNVVFFFVDNLLRNKHVPFPMIDNWTHAREQTKKTHHIKHCKHHS